MIAVEGYKAFSGEMRITPKYSNSQPYTVTGDWLYKPDTNCWYCKGSSYPAEICAPSVDEAIASAVREMALAAKLNAFQSIFKMEIVDMLLALSEQRVAILPCKIGKVAWVLDTEDCDGGADTIFRGEVVRFYQTSDGEWWVVIENMTRKCWFAGTDRRVSDLGTDWFLTLADAQAAVEGKTDDCVQ